MTANAKSCPQCGAELPAGAGEQPCPACLMKLGLESWAGPAAGSQSSPTQPYSTRPDPPTVEELAPRFPQFELLSLVGSGGMGAVYKARQKSLDRIVAVKIIHRDAAGQPGFSERFAREARAMARLNHPNIVTIHDFGSVPAATAADDAHEPTSVSDQPLYFLVMEYVEGTNLRELLRQKRLTPQQALAIVPPICDALQFAHDEGIVHRDIKPANILIDQKNRVKIADFGLAKLLGQGPRDVTLTEAHHAMGTAHYMAPEQLERPLEVDHRADIYALGVTFYEMLTGELPIGRFAPPSHKVQIDVRLDEIVLRTLEKQPERRYQHASEVKTAVESCTASAQQVAIPASDESVPSVAQKLRAPAIGLIIFGGISLAFGGMHLLGTVLQWKEGGYAAMLREVSAIGPIALTAMVLNVLVGILAIVAGIRMQTCQSRGLSVAASILAMLPLGPMFVSGLPIGIWVLMVLNRTDVRAGFAQVAGRRFSGTTNFDLSRSSSWPPAAFAPGAAPRMLVLTLGFVTSLVFATVGIGLLAYAAMSYSPVDGRWAGYLGGGFGSLIGGIGGLVGSWNQLRTMRGKLELMCDPNRNFLDSLLLIYSLLGLLCLGVAAICWPSLDFWQRHIALLIGGIATLQGIGFSLWRLAMRRAAVRQSAQPVLDLRMVLVAVSMLMCVLVAAGGILLLVINFTMLPFGSGRFWGGMGAAMGCLVGGGGGFIGTWNAYRSLEGLPDWMTEGKLNTLDRWMIITAGFGAMLMIAGVVAAPWVTGTSIYALELLGGILTLQAGMFLAIRALMRRAARQEAEHRPDS